MGLLEKGVINSNPYLNAAEPNTAELLGRIAFIKD